MSELETKPAVELNPEDMENVAGGYKKPPEKKGYFIYKIKKGDKLGQIARDNNCTVKDLMRWNPKITDPNRIYYDDYIYIQK